ncbi:gamma subclass chorismate mutase AroQ [Vibrio coralliilyticus]|uniref:gamma subclass chorismate mutase AroQ n=1 Tax=Vibrio TaxID=662 RepID=UPI000507BF90|nr:MULTISPECIES: gamma subclass chorismate mutase AroQ [Vibrio]KFI10887.1 chorismate mutase [Vibrio sp. B183]NOI18218.1 gamma subclass chorismate mutase AroQ [Vibrio coralliilyticus]
MRLLPLLLTSAVMSFQVFASPTKTDIFSTIDHRLSYMEDVALHKANNGIAVEDKKRDAVVIESASVAAEKEGLDKQSVEAFFAAQISAAKAIQFRYRADLLTAQETRTPRDLKTVIRPELIKLGQEITSGIAEYLDEGGEFKQSDWPTFQAAINERYLTDADKKALFAALVLIKTQ